jgi:6-pyruvoyltetrahydropterin/6-carboxytetrahydropterin synthase
MKEQLIRSCTKAFKFDAAHRIIGHQNKCQYLHGHTYTLEITAASHKLNELGMVVDFSLLKSLAGNWINANFDHTTILSKEDQDLGNYIEKITGQKVFYLDNHPTAENLATFFKYNICQKLFASYADDFTITKIKLFETANSWVEV